MGKLADARSRAAQRSLDRITNTSYHIEGKLDGVTFYWSEQGWVDDERLALRFSYAGALAEAAKIKPWCDDNGVTQRPMIRSDRCATT